MSTLPIEACKQALLSSLKLQSQAILQAPPGAGKTSRVPLWLLEQSPVDKKIYLLQPRRLACLASAKHLSSQLSQEVGQRVGYRVRFEHRTSAQTQIEVITIGIFLQILQNNPELHGVHCVIFDEFHERSLDNDLAFALTHACKEYYHPQLNIVLMSATLNTHLLQKKLGWPLIKSEGKQYPLQRHFNAASDFQQQVNYILQRQKQADGHILVFLAGKKEIAKFARAISKAHILHGQINLQQQQHILNLPTEKQIILSTNIAESSVTINGVREVIDFGEERFLQVNQKGLQSLRTRQISQASCEQRAGRAARQGAGHYTAMWSKEVVLVAQSPSAICEQDFSLHLLRILLWGLEIEELLLLELPKISELQRCRQLLVQLNCIDSQGALDTDLSQQLLDYSCPLAIAKFLSLTNHSLRSEFINLASFLEQQQHTHNQLEKDTRLFWQTQQQRSKHDPTVKQQRRWLALIRKQTGTKLNLNQALIQAMPANIAMLKDSNYIGALGQQYRFTHPEQAQWILVLQSLRTAQSHRISSWVALKEEQIKPYIHKQHTFSQDGLQALEQHCVGKIVIRQHPTQLSANQRKHALVACLQQYGLQLVCHRKETQQFLQRLHWASQYLDEFKNYSPTKLNADLNWILGYLDNIKQLKHIAIDTILKQHIGFKLTKLLDLHLPTHILIPSGDRIALDYQEQQVILAAKIQGLFGLNRTPSICKGRICLLVQLLSPSAKPVQTTQDLLSFWKEGYFLVKKELKGRYPRHPWPDNPMQATATLMSKKQFEAKHGKPK